MLTITDTIKEIPENVKQFFINNNHSVVWIVLFFVGVILFTIVYKALNK